MLKINFQKNLKPLNYLHTDTLNFVTFINNSYFCLSIAGKLPTSKITR